MWDRIFPLFYQGLKLKKFDILVAHGELIRDCFLAELLSERLLTIVVWQQILFIRIASSLGEWPRSTASVQRLSEACSFWSGTPLPASPLPRVAKADLGCLSFIALAVYWTLVSQLLPPHLSDVFLLKSLKSLETTYKWGLSKEYSVLEDKLGLFVDVVFCRSAGLLIDGRVKLHFYSAPALSLTCCCWRLGLLYFFLLLSLSYLAFFNSEYAFENIFLKNSLFPSFLKYEIHKKIKINVKFMPSNGWWLMNSSLSMFMTY